MPSWIVLLLVVLALTIGVIIGIAIQRRHIPLRLLRLAKARDASFKDHRRLSRDRVIKLSVRRFEHAYDWHRHYTEKDGQYVDRTLEIGLSQLALVLIDVWAAHPNKGWMARADQNIRTKLIPLLNQVRENGILVVHCPHDRPMNGLVKPMPHEPVLDDPGEKERLMKMLRRQGIRYLLYAGYASNICLLTRPVSIIQMAQLGYEIIFIRDASLAVEAPQYLEKELTHSVVTNLIETNWGVTTKVDQVLVALDSR